MRLLCSITTDQSNPKLWGYFDQPLSCKFTSKGHFYPKIKFEVVPEKNLNVLHTENAGISV